MTSRRGSILVGVIIIIVCCGIAYVFDFKPLFPNPFSPSTLAPAPTMPEVKEVKSEPPFKSPVLDEALKNQTEDEKVEVLIEKLRKENIKISVFIDDAIAIKFLNKLLVDKDSQKIFRYFSKKGIGIYLHERYRISGGLVFINAKDSPKKAAKWLATGKI